MRWLPFAALAGCSFSPGTLATDMPDDARVDTADGADDPDGMPDGPSPLQVRRIDVVDAQVVGSHTDFPLLVALTETWIASIPNGGAVQRDDGFDIYFSLDQAGTMRLAHEIEAYDPVAGQLLAWVKVPTLDTQASLFLHYGDPAITTTQAMPTQVWTNGYELVVHMNGTGDATGKSGNVPQAGTVLATGFVGTGRQFDGGLSYSNAQSAASVDDVFAAGGTIEAWFKPATIGGGSFGRIFDKGNWGLILDNTNVTEGVTFFHSSSQNDYVGQWHVPTIPNLFGSWHHIAVTYDKTSENNDPDAVIDGADVAITEDNPPNGTMISDSASNWIIGNRAQQDRGFDGVMDEIRASSVIRTDAWLTTQHRNHTSPATFYTVSDPL